MSALLERESQIFEDTQDTSEELKHRKLRGEIYREAFGPNEPKAEDLAVRIAPYTVRQPAAVQTAPTPSPVASVEEAPVRRELFADLEYKDHTLVHTAARASVETIARPEVVTAPKTAEDEDVLPTQRTMRTLERTERTARESAQLASPVLPQQEERVGFFASLSSKTKMALAIISALVVVAIALVCINTGIINSMKSNLTSKQRELEGLTQYSEELGGRIEEVTDPAFVDDYAEHELMMTRS